MMENNAGKASRNAPAMLLKGESIRNDPTGASAV
jgi:hypothetical protein